MEDYFVACPNCGGVNRFQPGKPGAVCGRCKTKLPEAGHTETVTDPQFNAFSNTARLPVLIDFWAPWCGPCRMVGPVVEQIAEKYFGKLRVGKLNTDENQGTAGSLQIRSIPTLILFKDGKIVDRLSGALPAPQLEAWLTARMESRTTRCGIHVSCCTAFRG
jgi:thioredoxin 2